MSILLHSIRMENGVTGTTDSLSSAVNKKLILSNVIGTHQREEGVTLCERDTCHQKGAAKRASRTWTIKKLYERRLSSLSTDRRWDEHKERCGVQECGGGCVPR